MFRSVAVTFAVFATATAYAQDQACKYQELAALLEGQGEGGCTEASKVYESITLGQLAPDNLGDLCYNDACIQLLRDAKQVQPEDCKFPNAEKSLYTLLFNPLKAICPDVVISTAIEGSSMMDGSIGSGSMDGFVGSESGSMDGVVGSGSGLDGEVGSDEDGAGSIFVYSLSFSVSTCLVLASLLC